VGLDYVSASSVSTLLSKTAPAMKRRSQDPRHHNPKPDQGRRKANYTIVSIAMYNEDVEKLDKDIDRLKAEGWSAAGRSKLIRIALSRLDISTITDEEKQDGCDATG
jgi:hypothetical protein